MGWALLKTALLFIATALNSFCTGAAANGVAFTDTNGKG
jgi:hypothetical protein